MSTPQHLLAMDYKTTDYKSHEFSDGRKSLMSTAMIVFGQ